MCVIADNSTNKKGRCYHPSASHVCVRIVIGVNLAATISIVAG